MRLSDIFFLEKLHEITNFIIFQQAEDCSEALEKFQPAVDSNLLSRIRCFWLRGKSLVALGLASHGDRELQMAAQLDPQHFAKNEAYFLSTY